MRTRRERNAALVNHYIASGRLRWTPSDGRDWGQSQRGPRRAPSVPLVNRHHYSRIALDSGRRPRALALGREMDIP